MLDAERLNHFVAMRCFRNVTHKVSHWAIANIFCLLRVIVQVVLHLVLLYANKYKSLTHSPATVVLQLIKYEDERCSKVVCLDML